MTINVVFLDFFTAYICFYLCLYICFIYVFPVSSFVQNEGGDDKFNWGVKRHSVDLEDVEEVNMKDGCSANVSCKDESSDDEVRRWNVLGKACGSLSQLTSLSVVFLVMSQGLGIKF